MSHNRIGGPARRQLRLWPGVAAVALQWVIRFLMPLVVPGSELYAVLVGTALGLVVLLWWLFFSRAPWVDRLGAFALMVVALLITARLVHPSIAGGMMGMLLTIYSIPVLGLALVVWAVATRGLANGPRRVALVAIVALVCVGWTLIRTEGIRGVRSDFRWRWTPTAEERLLAQAADEPTLAPPTDAPAAASPAVPAAVVPREPAADGVPAGATPVAPDATPAAPAPASASSPAPAPVALWPGFRGPRRDGVVHGVHIKTDWSTAPPVELWRRPVGPGWSSFAVAGNRIFTQEQRGEHEVVAAYDLATGDPVWRHRDSTRFWESNAGAGPRATPTVSGGRLYSVGATGIVNALDLSTGRAIWSRNAGTDAGREVPGWGFAGSPLVVGDLVIVAAAGDLVAYDARTGTPRWKGPEGRSGYSSPHLITVDGQPQVLLLSGAGATSLSPSDGTPLWSHPLPSGTRIVQPSQTAEGDLLLHDGDSSDLRRVAVSRGDAGGWTVTERWKSNGLKPYFSDFVVHGGHAYGFDGRFLACIDLTDGSRKWKGGRYGNGQLLLVADQDVLIVVTEDGELALVEAKPAGFTELARLPAIEGKTWNHPVLVGGVLLVRNDREMVAFQLGREGSD